jgi:hypothetical protein
MRVLTVLSQSVLVALALISNAAAVQKPKFPNLIKLSYETIGLAASSPKPLATVAYDPKSLKYSLESWTPPSVDNHQSIGGNPSSSPLVRVLLPDGSSTVTGLATFDPSYKQTIDLWVSSDKDGAIFSASITSLTPPPLSAEEDRLRKKIERAKARGKPIPSAPKPKKPKKKSKDQPEVEDPEQDAMVKVNLIPAVAGPTPKLNSRKPPQVDAAGNEIPAAEEQPEKSFFQKYWWVLMILAVVTLAGGGGEK